MTLKEEVKELWKIVKVISENMQEVSSKLNDTVDRFNKYKWINEAKAEIGHTVFLQVKSQLKKEINEGLGQALEDADIRQKLKEVVEEVLKNSKFSTNNPAIV